VEKSSPRIWAAPVLTGQRKQPPSRQKFAKSGHTGSEQAHSRRRKWSSSTKSEMTVSAIINNKHFAI
jgi:hypothetical protein